MIFEYSSLNLRSNTLNDARVFEFFQAALTAERWTCAVRRAADR
jgi:hypothetical protein